MKNTCESGESDMFTNRPTICFPLQSAALVTSGTATLETAFSNMPEVVCYKTSGFSYAVAKRLIRVPFISLVNLIMEKEVVRELIQDDFNEAQLVAELDQDIAKRSRAGHSIKRLRNFASS